MNKNNVMCSKISVDCVKNDPVDIRCGGPEYLGFDFFVKEEDAVETEKFIVVKLNDLEIPLISIYENGTMQLPESDVWTKEKILESLKDNADDIKKEANKGYSLIKKR